MKKAYIAGPMRHWPEENFPAFHTAARSLRDLGLDVFNPAEGLPHGKPFSEYMRQDLPELFTCDLVVVLPEWECSRGAILEVSVARALDIPIYEIGSYLLGHEDAVSQCPAELASRACAESMKEGITNHGPGVWKMGKLMEHTSKSSRHLITANLMACGVQKNDSEGAAGHLRNAVCRAAMALTLSTK